MSRKPIIAGNWKLNKTIREAIDLVTGLKRNLYDVNEVDIVVCPPFTAISPVSEVLSESNIGVGGQNLYLEETGAFTGEVSASMLKEAGAQYVIIGHSERRALFGETNVGVNKKIKIALKEKLTPIVCVGETLEERKSDQTFKVIESQITEGLESLTPDQLSECVMAYEPVWAIGTGLNATPEQAQEVHKFIRELLVKNFNKEVANGIRIQYGGSVKPDNVAGLMSQEDVDGALVGGASLDVDSFTKIVKFQEATTQPSPSK